MVVCFVLVMVLPDAPISQQTWHAWKYTIGARLIIFKFFLFLTFFTERGSFVLVLAPQLQELGRALRPFHVPGAGRIITCCFCVVGWRRFCWVSFLDEVRKKVQLRPGDILQGCPPGVCSKVQLKLICEGKCSTVTFQDGDLDHVMA